MLRFPLYLLFLAFLTVGARAALSPVPADTAREEESDTSAVSDIGAVSETPQLPFEIRPPSRAQVAAFQTAWRRALLAFRAGGYADAARNLRGAEASEKLAQVYRAAFFAQACMRAGLMREADSAAKDVLRWVRGEGWQRHFYTIRLRAFDFSGASVSALKEFCDQALQAPLEARAQADLLYRLLALDSSALPGSERMAAARRLLRFAPKEPRLDTVYRRWAALFPPGKGGWDAQKLMLDWEEKLGYSQKALARNAAMSTLTPGKAEKQALQWDAANIAFRKGAMTEAIRQYRQYQDRNGDAPDVFLQLARAYDKLADTARSRMWYAWFAEKYPRHPKSGEVFWIRAFDAETEGRNAEAVELYLRQSAEYPGTRRADWARFRVGLVYYKRGDFSAAFQAFQALRVADTSAPALSAGLYWESKSLLAQGDSSAGRNALLELGTRYPFNFYGHLARFQLSAQGAWPESLEWRNRFPSASAEEAKDWLARNAPGFSDSLDRSGESAYLPVAKLLQWHLDTLAILALRGLPEAPPSNPWLLYIDARRFQAAGLWSEAARFGIKLGNIIPIENWASAPLPVLRVLYPPAYADPARLEAARSGLPAPLVQAVMKQESGFDARIVSRAGARGLMQMLPFTGALQAVREGLVGFEADALFDPETNLRLGTAFLRDVIRRHGGNLYFSLAHYNAGPKALARWMPQFSGRPIEEAVEDIGYWETRDYVKRVLANYWTYRELYESSPPDPLSMPKRMERGER